MDKNSIQNLYEADASIIIHLFYSQYNLKLPIYVQPPRHKHWVEREKKTSQKVQYERVKTKMAYEAMSHPVS